jgi:hypothetical protein
MDKLGKEFHTTSDCIKQNDEVTFMHWRERKIWEFVNKQFYEMEKWTNGEKARRATLAKFEKACRDLKEKEMDKLELLWKKS